MNNEKNIIAISAIYPDSLRTSLLEKKAFLDLAAQTFEKAAISGLSKQQVNLTVITSPVVRSQKNVAKWIRGYSFKSNTEKDSEDIYVGNVTIPVINKIYELIAIRKELSRISKKNTNSSIVIFSLHSPFLLAYYSLRHKFKNSCVVVYDLPQYMSSTRSFIYRFAKRIDERIINKCISKINSFVLLSQDMVKALPIKSKKWTVIEGIYNSTDSIEKGIDSDEKIILYTGGISQRYGVFDLIEAFKQIPDNSYRLYLCGNCNETELLNSELEKDSRIIYLGLIDKSEVYQLQSKATLLVNPRHSYHDFTRYSFPSKTMEYMASGTPTVMCKLPALPKEYLDYIFIFEDESINGYAKKIQEICSKDLSYLKVFGERASKFIKSQKNEIVQTKKIIDLLY